MTDATRPDDTAPYPIGPRNRVKRIHERGRYDRATVWAVLDAAMLCHVAYVVDGQPFCTPTIHWRDGDHLYWHGSAASRMLRKQPGTAVCVTVSHLDALVLARSGFNHSADYRSAMCFGTARPIEDPDEKRAALDALIDRYYPDRAATLRPIDPQEFKATTVIGMRIEDASAKIRAAGVKDDEADLGHPVWAGVIPVRTVIGEIEACPEGLADQTRPDTLASYRPGRTLDDALLETQRLYERR